MAQVFPFTAYTYNLAKVELDKVVTQPYDKIDPQLQEVYYKRSPYNFVRIIKGKEQVEDDESKNKYTRARDYLQKWIDEGILIRDKEPSIYPYNQEYEVEGKLKVRWGLIVLTRLEPYGMGVRAHERTLAAPKADRLNLMRATGSNFGHIFMLYSDPRRRVSQLLQPLVEKESPILRAKDDFGATHKVWRVNDPETIRQVQEALADKVLFIADGHHRYETAVNYAEEMRKKGLKPIGNESYENRMITLVNIEEPGLAILPTHRLIHSLKGFNISSYIEQTKRYFRVEEFPYRPQGEERAKEKLFREMEKRGNKEHLFGLFARGADRFYLLSLKDESIMDELVKEERPAAWKRLDVSILHAILMNKLLGIDARALELQTNVTYERYKDSAIEKVKKDDKYQLVFFLNPTKVHNVKEVAELGERMPQKSTDFFPKLLSGLTINKMNLSEAEVS